MNICIAQNLIQYLDELSALDKHTHTDRHRHTHTNLISNQSDNTSPVFKDKLFSTALLYTRQQRQNAY